MPSLFQLETGRLGDAIEGCAVRRIADQLHNIARSGKLHCRCHVVIREDNGRGGQLAGNSEQSGFRGLEPGPVAVQFVNLVVRTAEFPQTLLGQAGSRTRRGPAVR